MIIHSTFVQFALVQHTKQGKCLFRRKKAPDFRRGLLQRSLMIVNDYRLEVSRYREAAVGSDEWCATLLMRGHDASRCVGGNPCTWDGQQRISGQVDSVEYGRTIYGVRDHHY